MAMVDRPVSFLPTIKCSSCSREIEISRMGEHICSDVDDIVDDIVDDSADYTSSHNSLASTVYDNKRYEDLDVASNVSGSPRYDSSSNNTYGFGSGRDDRGHVPPQVDTFAANRNYNRPDQLTPVSNSSGSQSVSPKTPVGTRRPGMGMNSAAASSDYFEPTIAGDDSPSQRRPGGYGGLAVEPDSNSNNNSNNNINNNNTNNSNNSNAAGNYAPISPLKPAAPSLLQRMNTIAPGPFDVSRRPSNALARQQRDARDDEFDPPVIGRAGTFPRLNSPSPTQHAQNLGDVQYGEPPARAPSAPGPRPDRRQHSVVSNGSSYDGGDGFYRSSSARLLGPDTSRAPPPRTSLLRPRTAAGDGPSSPGGVPQINLADEFGIGNPYHSPHDSMSSALSSGSQPSIAFSSSQSSFSSAFSASSFSTSSSANSLINNSNNNSQPARQNGKSNTADVDGVTNDLQSMNMSDRGLPSPQMQMQTSPMPSPTFNAGFERRPSQAQIQPERRMQDPPQPERRPSQDPYPPRRPSQDPYPPQDRHPSRVDNAHSPNNSSDSYGARTRTPAPAPALAPALAPAPAAPTPVAAPPSRGNCKACRKPITGKSVSSADGRLTGRYHKACFVCTTCAQPFTSAEFYVHNDMPYCERHYHEVNGSLCGTCNNGIEGQYLADESDCKHHRTCFVCGDCSQPLEDGYFEVGGKVYCERDAWRRLQKQQQQQQQQQQYQYQQQQQQQQKQYQQPYQQQPYQPPNRYMQKSNLAVPRGLPSGPGMARRPSNANVPMSMGMSSGMGKGPLAPPRQYGLPNGNRMGNGMGMGPGPRPRMEKRMTRLGMM